MLSCHKINNEDEYHLPYYTLYVYMLTVLYIVAQINITFKTATTIF